MKEFATSGVNQDELKELLELVASKATFLSSLLAYLLNNTIMAMDKVKCPDHWIEFITALAGTSPVCALIRPDPQLHRVIKQIANGLNSFETSMLHFLQQNCPILVNLIQKVHILRSAQSVGQHIQHSCREYLLFSAVMVCNLSLFDFILDP